MKTRGYSDLLWTLYSGAALTFIFIVVGLMTTPYQAHAQISPLTEDQDGNVDPLNEESDLMYDCDFDHTSGAELAAAFEGAFGDQFEAPPPTLSEDDCNFAMHYLSGQCEQTPKGVNVTGVCNTTLRDYLSAKDLYTKDYPTDTERFNTILDRYKQNEVSEEQASAQKEANKPSWAEGLE